MNDICEKTSAGAIEISAVLPAFNEEESLEPVAAELVKALEKYAAGFEVIIVDDGSEDNTAAVADRLSAGDPRIRVIRHDKNQGYGAALRSGFAAAAREWIFFMDADGQFDPQDLGSLAALSGSHDFIAGKRSRRKDSALRRLYGAVFSMKVRWLFKVSVDDVNCAFKLFRKSIISGHKFITSGALINAELLAVAANKGVVPVQVPVTHRPRMAGSATGGSLPVIFRAFREMVLLWWRMKRADHA